MPSTDDPKMVKIDGGSFNMGDERGIGEPDEIAGAAIFLASAAGSFTTGQTLVIDGGGTIAG